MAYIAWRVSTVTGSSEVGESAALHKLIEDLQLWHRTRNQGDVMVTPLSTTGYTSIASVSR